ncbi:hypothetical protein PPMP20_36970 [Paraburkholderia phymatum]|uniref:hypothetical protein n=1 Tax=Paraburkholderia phymatum TaxID=148447 RepID=UPI0012FE3C00|nr:hypothetical protein [Paraburkholderia phymatum]
MGEKLAFKLNDVQRARGVSVWRGKVCNANAALLTRICILEGNLSPFAQTSPPNRSLIDLYHRRERILERYEHLFAAED